MEGAKIEIDVRDNQVVILSRSVPTGAAKQKAEQLANDSTGVSSVVNELAVVGAPSP